MDCIHNLSPRQAVLQAWATRAAAAFERQSLPT